MLELGTAVTQIQSLPRSRTTPPSAPLRPDFSELSLEPAFLYHPQTAAVSVVDGRVVNVVGEGSTPPLLTETLGPIEHIDLEGHKCWRFEDGATLDLPADFTMTPRAFTLFMVARQHKSRNNCYYFSPKYQSDGTTPANTLGAFFQSYGAGNRAPWLRCTNQFGYDADENVEQFGVGAQKACFGVASRSNANGGIRFFMNGLSGADSQAGSSLSNCLGGRFGGYFNANSSTSGFDAYCIVGFSGELTDAQAVAVSSILTEFYDLAPIAKNLILEGDSITDGVGELALSENLAMALTEPGSGLMPSNVRVINRAVSGGDVADAVIRRDNSRGWPLLKIGSNSADNKVAFQIGRNDTASGGLTPTQAYASILSYWNDSVSGLISRGWSGAQMANIACDSGLTTTQLSDLIRYNFANDVPQAEMIDLQLITDHGFMPFVLGAQNGVYYQDNDGSLDITHPSALGTEVMAHGADTPQHSYSAIF